MIEVEVKKQRNDTTMKIFNNSVCLLMHCTEFTLHVAQFHSYFAFGLKSTRSTSQPAFYYRSVCSASV